MFGTPYVGGEEIKQDDRPVTGDTQELFLLLSVELHHKQGDPVFRQRLPRLNIKITSRNSIFFTPKYKILPLGILMF
jgi:hypothetical protein